MRQALRPIWRGPFDMYSNGTTNNGTMAARKRTKAFQVRMADEELDMLNALADDAGLSAADIVRLLVREAYRLKHGDKKPPPRNP
jgi:hypothetical protein